MMINNKMSIYSGFATRAQEELYDNCLDSLLSILQRRIIKFYQDEPADQQKFASLVLKIHHQLRAMEKNKYLEPKNSASINELVQFLQQNSFKAITTTLTEEDTKKGSHTQQLPQIENRASRQQQRNSNVDLPNPKKKSIYWVQKKQVDDQTSSKAPTEQKQATLMTNQDEKQFNKAITFGKTLYKPPIQARTKRRSKHQFSKEDISIDKRDPSPSRQLSNYTIQQHNPKPGGYKKKYRSNARITPHQHPNDNTEEVTEIIQEYIYKAKRHSGRSSSVQKGLSPKDF